MVVHYVSVRKITLHGGPYRVVLIEDPHAVAVVNAALNQGVTVARQRLVFRIGDLAGQAESTGRVTMRARISLHEDAMENSVFRIIYPVLFGKILTADSQVHTADR